jgi:uncharacterized membrane protein
MLEKATPERLAIFSDGVFAVLITVLVLELRPPDHPTYHALLLLWPTWLSCAVSYLFIAIVWINHHYLLADEAQNLRLHTLWNVVESPADPAKWWECILTGTDRFWKVGA